MQEHPIPQAVTSYEFHLVGNMTLKQFLELAAGFVAAFIVYQTNLYGVIKWPIVTFCVGLGAMIAFVPYEGRPLDHWLIALIRAIYKPTQFYWRKSREIPEYFSFTTTAPGYNKDEIDLTPYRQQRIHDYIQTLSPKTEDPIEIAELQRLTTIDQLFDSIIVEQVEVVAQISKPDLTAAPRPIQKYEAIFEVDAQPQLKAVAPNNPLPQPIVVPSQPVVEAEHAEVVEENTTETNTQQVEIFSSNQPQKTENTTTTADVQTSTTLPFPKKPTIPNLVVGMVFNGNGNIVENAIIEITDTQDTPVRAVRTNAIGQFFISTPLADGEYFVKVEKEGILFPVSRLTLNGQLVDPLEIKAEQNA